MAEKNPNLEGSISIDDLSGIDLNNLNGDLGTDEEKTGTDEQNSSSNGGTVSSIPDIDMGKLQLDGATNVLSKDGKGENDESSTSTIDENLFLDSGDKPRKKTRSSDDIENFGAYLTRFYSSSFLIVISILLAALFFSFSSYLNKATQMTLNDKEQKYVDSYKGKFGTVKGWMGTNNKSNYTTIPSDSEKMETRVNSVISADDIDYIDKKDILSPSVANMIRDTQNDIAKIDSINKDVAMQGFLPEELENILAEEQAIDTIQRSLNALEVIKFSTAMKVFSYLDSAIQTISEMIRISDSSPDDISQILNQVTSRGEKDISSYIYMCYLNPFEINANCDTIGDLDLYYNDIINDKTINLSLFKNVMSAINQLLEKEDTSLFSITFNGFNAQDKNITFNIEVFTNQNDERSLMLQGKKNPNIFILTNIINLLKQSSFIIGAEINTKEVNVETRNLDFGGFTSTVNYSSKDFTVPIQKDMEREIFDYIDLEAIIKMLKKMDIKIDASLWSDDLDNSRDSSEEIKDVEQEDNLDKDVQQKNEQEDNLDKDVQQKNEQEGNLDEDAQQKNESEEDKGTDRENISNEDA